MKSILIGERYREKLEKSLVNQGFEAIWMPDNPLLDPRLAGHADLSAIRLGNKLIVSKHIFEDEALVKKLTNRGLSLVCCEREQSIAYPNDINLCACAAGEYIIHNFTFTDPAIFEEINLKKISVKQGYSNCMILALGNQIISSDSGIVSNAAAMGLDVLKINSGHIRLDGFDEGFIGGASFVYNKKVYFTGDIRLHPQAEAICDFISAAGYDICSLNQGQLIDIGSAVVLD